MVLVLCAALTLTAGLATATAGNGEKNPCKNGRWQTVYRTDGTSFKNEDKCIDYLRAGGAISLPAPITTYLGIASACPTLAGYGVRGTGFKPNHVITFTATGFGTFSFGGGVGTVTTDASGAFDSLSDITSPPFNYFQVGIWVPGNPQTVHITATDGVHLGRTDIVNATC